MLVKCLNWCADSSGSRIWSGAKNGNFGEKFPSAHSTLVSPKGAPIRWGVQGLPRALEALGFKIVVCAFSPFSEHHFAQFLRRPDPISCRKWDVSYFMTLKKKKQFLCCICCNLYQQYINK